MSSILRRELTGLEALDMRDCALVSHAVLSAAAVQLDALTALDLSGTRCLWQHPRRAPGLSLRRALPCPRLPDDACRLALRHP